MLFKGRQSGLFEFSGAVGDLTFFIQEKNIPDLGQISCFCFDKLPYGRREMRLIGLALNQSANRQEGEIHGINNAGGILAHKLGLGLGFDMGFIYIAGPVSEDRSRA